MLTRKILRALFLAALPVLRFLPAACAEDPIHAGAFVLDSRQPDALHQISDKQLSDKVTSAQQFLFAPREAIRTPTRGGFGRAATGPQYPRTGAMIDYYLSAAPSGDITLES